MIIFQRATKIEHFEVIAKLAFKIWHEYYTSIIGKAQVDYMVEKFQTTEAMVNQAADGYEYYLIVFEDIPIGYLAIQKRDSILFLSKIYLLKTHRGKGIGKEAFSFIEKRAANLNCDKISLTVYKKNNNTIKAYQKIGFKIIEEIVIDIGNGFVMDDYLMSKSTI